jgi:hypothetical protein
MAVKFSHHRLSLLYFSILQAMMQQMMQQMPTGPPEVGSYT